VNHAAAALVSPPDDPLISHFSLPHALTRFIARSLPPNGIEVLCIAAKSSYRVRGCQSTGNGA
jgi:hypothetical protein